MSIELADHGQEVGSLPGMIERGAGQVFGAAATAHVEAVHGQAGLERSLRQASRIARVAGSFQAVNQDQLGTGLAGRLLRMDQDLDAGLGGIQLGLYREALQVQPSPPVIAGDGEQVRIGKEGDEGPQEIILVRSVTVAAQFKKTGTAKGNRPRMDTRRREKSLTLRGRHGQHRTDLGEHCANAGGHTREHRRAGYSQEGCQQRVLDHVLTASVAQRASQPCWEHPGLPDPDQKSHSFM